MKNILILLTVFILSSCGEDELCCKGEIDLDISNQFYKNNNVTLKEVKFHKTTIINNALLYEDNVFDYVVDDINALNPPPSANSAEPMRVTVSLTPPWNRKDVSFVYSCEGEDYTYRTKLNFTAKTLKGKEVANTRQNIDFQKCYGGSFSGCECCECVSVASP